MIRSKSVCIFALGGFVLIMHHGKKKKKAGPKHTPLQGFSFALTSVSHACWFALWEGAMTTTTTNQPCVISARRRRWNASRTYAQTNTFCRCWTVKFMKLVSAKMKEGLSSFVPAAELVVFSLQMNSRVRTEAEPTSSRRSWLGFWVHICPNSQADGETPPFFRTVSPIEAPPTSNYRQLMGFSWQGCTLCLFKLHISHLYLCKQEGFFLRDVLGRDCVWVPHHARQTGRLWCNVRITSRRSQLEVCTGRVVVEEDEEESMQASYSLLPPDLHPIVNLPSLIHRLLRNMGLCHVPQAS